MGRNEEKYTEKVGEVAEYDDITREEIKYVMQNGQQTLLKICRIAWGEQRIPKD